MEECEVCKTNGPPFRICFVCGQRACKECQAEGKDYCVWCDDQGLVGMANEIWDKAVDACAAKLRADAKGLAVLKRIRPTLKLKG